MSYGRFALVIGNADYSDTMKLKSPVNDAKNVSGVLRTLNFDCTERIDLRLEEMRNEFATFVQKLRDNNAEIALFYFSGHGIAYQDKNHILPIDFDAGDGPVSDRLIEIKPEIDNISEYSKIRLIFLDACRNNPSSPQILKTKGLSELAIAKAIFSGERLVRISGLNEMKADHNTFIAFATAPGGRAYDGIVQVFPYNKEVMSPFTASLVRHFDSVDLPLSNLMSRVRKEVYDTTQRMQIPWDQSSLEAPFYFNPGSLIIYIGNIMALLGLFVSFIPYSLVISSNNSTILDICLASLLPIFAIVILLYGMQSVYARMRDNLYEIGFEQSTLRDHLKLSLEKGLIGGYLGAILGSLWISVPYFYQWKTAVLTEAHLDTPKSLGFVMTEIAIATALVAGLLGTLCILATRISLTQKTITLLADRTWLRTIISSSVGGMLAGVIAAPLLMAYFGRFSRPEVTPDYLLPGAVIGSSILIFAIINFDYERLSIKRIKQSGIAALASLLCGLIVTLCIFGPLYALGIVDHVIDMLRKDFHDTFTMIAGSFAYGLPVGFILGIVIGTAVVLTEKFSAKPVV